MVLMLKSSTTLIKWEVLVKEIEIHSRVRRKCDLRLAMQVDEEPSAQARAFLNARAMALFVL